ncbi:elongation factor P [Patescibacteria group bacterium]|nr:elongation factor P [Patescibacteria group bacterium]
MPNIKAGNITKGSYIQFKNQPYMVTKADFTSPGKGSAFMRCKLKSVKTGQTQEFTYKSNETVEELEIQSLKMQFLYADSTSVFFMNDRTYEQQEVPLALLDDKLDLLTADVDVFILMSEVETLGVSLPPKVKLKVTEARDAVAGNTVGQARKEVTLETGLKVQAPLFIKTGDVLIIDTDSKQYVSRA